MIAPILPAIWRPECHQAIFRLLLDATARPGQVAALAAHLGEAHAALAVLATFCDATQSLADTTGSLSSAERNFLGARPAAPEAAAFILADGAAAPGFTPCLGSLDAPERGATVVLRVAELEAGEALTLTGPGIPGRRVMKLRGLAPEWLLARARWCAEFPLGCDLVLADATRVAVLPRTTNIMEE